MLLFVCTLTVCLLFAEGGLRWFETQDYSLPIRVNAEGFVVHKPNLDKKRYDNENEKKVHIRTNAEGFVGPNFTKDKPTGTLRIALFGDSFTEAMQVNYEDSYAYLLQKNLNDFLASATGTQYARAEVMNFGVGGTGTADAMLFYKQYGENYHPDMVIDAMYLGNDVDDNGKYVQYQEQLLGPFAAWSSVPEYGAADRHGWILLKDTVYRASALVRFVDKVARTNPLLHAALERVGIFRPMHAPEDKSTLFTMHYYYMQPRDSARQKNVVYTGQLLNHFAQTVRDGGRQFLLVLIPEGMPLHPDLFAKYLSAHDGLTTDNFVPPRLESDVVSEINTSTSFLSLTATIQQSLDAGAETYLVHGEGHLNEHGHVVVSQAIAQRIQQLVQQK